MKSYLHWLCVSGVVWAALAGAATSVDVSESRLVVDGAPQPFLFGAELQYFRARGGPGRNVPAKTVYAAWEKLLTRAEQAHLNTISLYVPWDFHEPAPGVFDFTGTLDRDHDGKPDYPSRDLMGFLHRIEAHGFKRVMIRPGPYINAEWGPQGFGAIPQWFLRQHPEALATTKTPGKPVTVSFNHPQFRRAVRAWFTALHRQVLRDFIGPNRPVLFLQIDNETNYFWDSIYERDRNPRTLARWHAFLKARFHNDLRRASQAYGVEIASFDGIAPPLDAADATYSGSWHYDWFHFHDEEIRDYYNFLRSTWERLGVREPQVRFTSCDSFNAFQNGLLPRLDYRDGDGLTLSTMNIYPKTSGTAAESALNTPMKAAHDVALMSSAHAQYYHGAGEWLLATETQGGWFPPTEVTLASREHTYGSLLGAGLKAMFLYYFHEGWNWDAKEEKDSVLRFDAPLDENLEPRPAFALIERLGAALSKDLGEKIVTSKPRYAPVLIAHDSTTQYPLPGQRDAIDIASTQSAGLYGAFREAGALPEVAFLDAMTPSEVQRFKLIVWNSPGYLSQHSELNLQAFLKLGGTVLWIGDERPKLNYGQVLYWKDNPARAWNTDDYLKQASAGAVLDQVRDVLRASGIAPESVRAKDGQPFLHVWTRDLKGNRRLWFVENFLGQPREIEMPALRGRKVVPLFTATPGLTAGIDGKLPVSAEGVDIWEADIGG